MKTSKSISLAMLSLVTALMLFSPSALAATQTPLSLQMAGMIVNAGSQHYVLDGGQIVTGSIFGNPVTSSNKLDFRLSTDVVGLGTSGQGSLRVSSGVGHDALLSADIQITDEFAAAYLPPGCTPGTCTSQVPLMFTGILTLDNQGQNGNSQNQPVPIAVESAYWDPLGLPIVITSLDSQTSPSIFLVVTYTKATIDWDSVQLQGTLGGTLGTTTPVTGAYTIVSNSQENLLAGSEKDSGQIAFVSMSPASLDVSGRYKGSTTFSLAGGFDCSSLFNLPPGTCFATGATSTGHFSMDADPGVKVSGTFSTVWSVPSEFTTTSATATVTQH
jgi:hypothetical protein